MSASGNASARKANPTKPVMCEVARKLFADDSVRFQTYEVPRQDGMTIQDLLRYIADELDGTFAFFEHSCKRGFCGSCLVTVNGRKVLSCRTLVPLEPHVLRIEPAMKTERDFWPAWPEED